MFILRTFAGCDWSVKDTNDLPITYTQSVQVCLKRSMTFWLWRFGATVLEPKLWRRDVLTPIHLDVKLFWHKVGFVRTFCRWRFGAETLWCQDFLAPIKFWRWAVSKVLIFFNSGCWENKYVYWLHFLPKKKFKPHLLMFKKKLEHDAFQLYLDLKISLDKLVNPNAAEQCYVYSNLVLQTRVIYLQQLFNTALH